MQRKWKRRWQRLANNIFPPLAAGLLFLSADNPALANPAGGTVVSGNAAITASGSTTTINQTSQKAILNWQSFSIGKGETVNFLQPSASAVALDRVVGSDASSIYGTLNANGKVFLINPNGILFAPGSQVSTGGLVASTLNIADSDFVNGRYTFSGAGTGSVVNLGTITAQNEAVLLGSKVANEGVVAAKVTGLAAGRQVTLDFSGDQLLNLTVDTGAAGGSTTNSGTITASGGLVVMSAGTKNSLLTTVVNNSGVIRAQSVHNENGVIRLEGSTVLNSGTLDASGKAAGQTGGTVKLLGDAVTVKTGSTIDVSGDAGGGTALVGGNYQGSGSKYYATNTTVEQGANSGNGGSVETSGKETLSLADGARVITTAAKGRTGNWLLDPTDFTIGTGANGANYWNNTALETALASSNITVQTNNTAGTDAGNITVAAPVAWSSETTLTLNAYNNVNINANITAAGDNAGLALTTGSGCYALGGGTKITLSGNNAVFSLNGVKYTVINEYSTGGALQALQNIGSNLSGKYFLGINIDAGGTGFTPIGTAGSAFSGVFDGGGHTIDQLHINSSSDYTGLFGYSGNGSVIRNVGLTDITVNSSTSVDVGGLVGFNDGGSIINSYSTGRVSGSANVGGLVGVNNGSIRNSYSTSTVSGDTNVGGLVGMNDGSNGIATISASYSTGTVSGSNFAVGGLVGVNAGAGGTATISNSYSTSTVSGGTNVGGLVGVNGAATISNSYSTGTVSGSSAVGGLVGWNDESDGTATISNSYWDVDTSHTTTGIGSGTSQGITGLSSKGTSGYASTYSASSYSSWDMATAGVSSAIWRIYDGYTYPLLRSFLTPLTVTANNATKTYDGNPYSGSSGVTYSTRDVTYSTSANPYGLPGTLSYAGGGVDVGTYTITPYGLYSGQQGYDISYASGTLSITQPAVVQPLPVVVINTPTYVVVANPPPPVVVINTPSPVVVVDSLTPKVNSQTTVNNTVSVRNVQNSDDENHQGNGFVDTVVDTVVNAVEDAWNWFSSWF